MFFVILMYQRSFLSYSSDKHGVVSMPSDVEISRNPLCDTWAAIKYGF